MAGRIILTDQPVLGTLPVPYRVHIRVLNADWTDFVARSLARAAEKGDLVVGPTRSEALSYVEGLIGRELPKEPDSIPLISIEDWVYIPAIVDGTYRLLEMFIRPVM